MPRNGSATSSLPDTYRQETLTSEASLTCDQTICADTRNATSSQELAGGPTLFGSPDGPTTKKSGPAHVRVSRFRARDSEKAISTNDTSGPLFSASSPSAALQRSLANRLAERMDLNGSPLFALTWKELDMPSGPPICRLAASERRISGDACSGWPTPNHNSTGPGAQGRDGGLTLQTAAQLASWPTTAARDWKNGKSNLHGTNARPLNEVAMLASWPTPMAGTPAQNGYNAAGNTDSSRKTVALLAPWSTPRANKRGFPDAHGSQKAPLASWATPRERDHHPSHKEGYQGNFRTDLGSEARLVATGPTSNGSHASTENGGQLNPAFSRWLQGFPKEWCEAAIQTHRSMRTIAQKRASAD